MGGGEGDKRDVKVRERKTKQLEAVKAQGRRKGVLNNS